MTSKRRKITVTVTNMNRYPITVRLEFMRIARGLAVGDRCPLCESGTIVDLNGLLMCSDALSVRGCALRKS